MAKIGFLKTHRTWEDYVGILLGAVTGMTPYIAGESSHPGVVINAMAVGILLLVLASFELVALRRSEEIEEFVLGAWLAASPFVFGYAWAGQLRWWHFAIGAVVACLALFELWQDWGLSDEDLARHGR